MERFTNCATFSVTRPMPINSVCTSVRSTFLNNKLPLYLVSPFHKRPRMEGAT
ncbi:hypothetical protein Plhal710r2_c030g0113101 [Plasmopara halstedii]